MKWISVKDKLPKTSGAKLVFVPLTDKPLIQLAWYETKGSNNLSGWQLLTQGLCNKITHWMELPEIPKDIK